MPPFTILDAGQAYWRDRKNAWLALGVRGPELGRGDSLLWSPSAQPASAYAAKEHYEQEIGKRVSWPEFQRCCPEVPLTTQTSEFDPVVAELAYAWFSPAGGRVLDPFAGGAVRGMVAARLGRAYVGIELRQEQVEVNRQAALLSEMIGPQWIVGDSRDVAALAPGPFDMIFSCPPYGDLERYSTDPRDLSTLPYGEFRSAYTSIIAASCEQLADDRFAVFMVGDIRDRKGFYRGFVRDTVAAFEAAGMKLYNEVIYVPPYGSLPARAGRQFERSRKLGKAHQNLLVFVKGTAKAAVSAVGSVVLAELEATS